MFQGTYKSIHVDKTEYLWHLCRYIHLNPLKLGLAKNLEDWPYSNWLEFVGKRNGELVPKKFLDDILINDYEEWVMDYYDGGEEDKAILRYI